MSWDGFQREALAELGFTVYVVADARAASAPTAAAGAEDATAARMPPSALIHALIRAAACTPAQLPPLPSLQQLAADPAAKRALWPQLRRLRARRE